MSASPFASFLPATVAHLTEADSIRTAHSIVRQAISVPLSPQPVETAYVRQGSRGPALLLLHGFDSSVLEFRYLLPLLTRHHRVWAVDLLGFGFTDRAGGLPAGPPAIRVHLYHFWQSVISEPVLLVGASMGGATAIDFALAHPEAVEKLVLIDSVGYTNAPPILKFLTPPLDYLAVEWWRQRKVQALALGTVLGGWVPAMVEQVRCAALHLEMPRWHEAMIAFNRSGGYGEMEEHIRRLDKQTLILWGDSDDVLSRDDARKFRLAIRDSRLIWIKNCGHAPQIEQPEITAQHILAFGRRRP